MVGAGFISFTILNSILSLGAKLTVVELAPRILPRMVDDIGAGVVEDWLKAHGVTVRDQREAGQDRGRQGAQAPEVRLRCAISSPTSSSWRRASGRTSRGSRTRACDIKQGIVVDEHLRSNVPNVYAAGDVAQGRDLISGQSAVHAIEPTAQEHGRIVGANMAGKDVRYRGSLIINIVEVCHLDVASFGAWDDARAEAISGLKKDRNAYRKLLFTGERLTGAIIIGRSNDIWTTNDVGMLKGLVQSGQPLGRYKDHLRRNPFDVKTVFIAARTTSALLPETILGRPSKAPGDSPVAV